MLEDTSPQYRNRNLESTEPNRPDDESGSQIRETIEDATRRVRDTVSDATHQMRDQVKGAASNVREQVEGAVDEVRGFDLRQQVATHPWMAVSVAAVAGYVFGIMGGDDDGHADREHGQNSHSKQRKPNEQRPSSADLQATNAYHWAASAPYGSYPSSSGFVGQGAESRSYQSAAAYQPMPQSYQSPTYASSSMAQSDQFNRRSQQPQRSQMWDTVRNQFGGELRTLVTAAVGTAIGLVRETVTEHVPQFAEEYERRSNERNGENASSQDKHAASPTGNRTASTSGSSQGRSSFSSEAASSSTQSGQTASTPGSNQGHSSSTSEPMTPSTGNRKRESGA